MELSILFDRFPRLVLDVVSYWAFKIGEFSNKNLFLDSWHQRKKSLKKQRMQLKKWSRKLQPRKL